MGKNPLLPYVPDFEKEAETFLKFYGKEDAITTPQPIYLQKIVERMSLKVCQDYYLFGGDGVCGEIVFFKGNYKIRDLDTFTAKEIWVSEPTIFINASITNYGRFRNTVAHECYHWWKHRNYLRYRRNKQFGNEIGIFDNSMIEDTEFAKDIQQMEFQAKNMAGRILMPGPATRIKVHEILLKLGENPKYTPSDESITELIKELADFFLVSKQAAAVRLCMLYRSWAQDYYDRHQHTEENNAAYRIGSPITIEDAFNLYMRDSNFRSVIDSGALRFIDGYYVLNDAAYITDDNHLTSLALNNLASCTLAITYVAPINPELMKGDRLLRSDTPNKKQPSYNPNAVQNDELQKKIEQFEKFNELRSKNCQTGNQWFQERMSFEGWKKDDFLNLTLLDEIAYTRVNKPDYKFSLTSVLAICVGLSLNLEEVNTVLNLYGLSLSDAIDAHRAYKFLFIAFYGKSIIECNAFLEARGIKPLGTIQKE